MLAKSGGDLKLPPDLNIGNVLVHHQSVFSVRQKRGFIEQKIGSLRWPITFVAGGTGLRFNISFCHLRRTGVWCYFTK